MPIKTIIIEAEEKTLQSIGNLINRYAPNLEVCGTASDIPSAIALIESELPDLVLMDVVIGKGSGFDILRSLSDRNFELIFMTANDNYALEAIRFAAIDYLLKPVGIPEFKSAVDRLELRLREKIGYTTLETLMHNLSQSDADNRKLSIASTNGYEFVNLSDIVWCNSEGSYTIFHLVNKTKVTSSRNIGYYEEIFNTNEFFRVSNSVIINLRYLKSYTRNQGTVTMTDGTTVAISTRKRSEFLETLKSSRYLKGFQ